MKIKNIPKHVGIIPDGNRRWAKSKGFASTLGHYKAGSYKHIGEIFKEGQKLGVKYMSIWGFSTENWNRSKVEIKAIWDVVSKGVEKFTIDAHKNKIRFRHIGRKDRMPKFLSEKLEKLEKETKNYSKFNVQLCLDYGGLDETIRAINKIIKSKKKKIYEKDFRNSLDSSKIPYLDLIIRTSGENRTSGFMPYQSAYAELYFSKLNFPDFMAKDLRKAIIDFSNRKRRYGK